MCIRIIIVVVDRGWMAVSVEAFPPRKRRPAAGSFFSPHLSELQLLQSLHALSLEVANLRPLRFLLRRNSASIIRKTDLLSILLQELLRHHPNRNRTSSSSSSGIVLCYREMYIVLQRINTLLEDCSNGSNLWLLLHHRSVADTFHELNVDLSTLLDIFPIDHADLHQDVREIAALIRKQSRQAEAFVDPRDEHLRRQVLSLLHQIHREVVPDPSHLAAIFRCLGLSDSASCRDEIESLQDEAHLHQSNADLIALIALVRYARCVLFAPSTPRPSAATKKPASAEPPSVPADFRCPITLELMRDPVVVATGQTYDRASINSWIDSGHNTCPKTAQALPHTALIPNRALQNLIALWCRHHRIPFDAAADFAAAHNKTALEATKMTASFLLGKLTASPSHSAEAANRLVYELRALAKTDANSRACIAEAGAIPVLVNHLASAHPDLQVNAVTTLLNLSILDANKARIMEADGAVSAVVEVLRSGATWEAKGNAAATLFSLSGVHAYRRKLGRKARVVKGLVDLAKEGPREAKRDALMAILNLAADREALGRLLEEGAVDAACQEMGALPEETVAILETVVKKGGLVAVALAYRLRAIRKLAVAMREGSEKARERAAATLVYICRRGGSEAVAELAAVPGIERLAWELMGMGMRSERASRKAATLMRILRRWAASVDGDLMMSPSAGYSAATVAVRNTRLIIN